jgi:hypoxanthine-DNA glycosylase
MPVTPILRGLAPIENPHACVLILGSMPGAASLLAGQYYAHGQNRFWTFMGELVGATPQSPYDQRVQQLREAGIALWDVIASCERTGSLDSAIRNEMANDFATFFASHPAVRTVLFNGAKAEQSFRRDALPAVAHLGLVLQRLPSTSPANASQPAARKLGEWRSALMQAGVRLQAST